VLNVTTGGGTAFPRRDTRLFERCPVETPSDPLPRPVVAVRSLAPAHHQRGRSTCSPVADSSASCFPTVQATEPCPRPTAPHPFFSSVRRLEGVCLPFLSLHFPLPENNLTSFPLCARFLRQVISVEPMSRLFPFCYHLSDV